jgi:hypothetical protein
MRDAMLVLFLILAAMMVGASIVAQIGHLVGAF